MYAGLIMIISVFAFALRKRVVSEQVRNRSGLYTLHRLSDQIRWVPRSFSDGGELQNRGFVADCREDCRIWVARSTREGDRDSSLLQIQIRWIWSLLFCHKRRIQTLRSGLLNRSPLKETDMLQI